jgi:type VI secretion system protein ImpA
MIPYNEIIQPINGNNPAGIDARLEDSLLTDYLNLKEIRNNLRKEERKNIEVDNNLIIDKQAWEEVITLAGKILSNYSKDIEIAVWLLEGLTRCEEFKGVKTGLDIICYFFDKYIEYIYPLSQEMDEEDDNPKLIPISMLSGKYEAGTLIAPIYFCELIKTRSGKSYNAWEIKKILSVKNKNKINHDVTIDEILQCDELKSAMENIDEEHFLQLKDNLVNCMSSFKEFNLILTKNFERYAPNLSNLNNSLSYCFSIINTATKITQQILQKPTEIAEENNNQQLLNITNLDHKKLSRTEAKNLLEMLVKFFGELEPHSPVSYTLARALKWCDMELPKMLCEIMPDEMRAEYCKFSGVPFLSLNSFNRDRQRAYCED